MINVAFEAPKKMLDFANSPDAKNKPYDLCLLCPFMSESCDGPNILAMEYPRWVEWANARAKQMGLTRARISELSMVPKGTVDSALSGRNDDIRSTTMRDITRVLVGGCWGMYPCHFASLLINGATDGATIDPAAEELKERLAKAEGELQQRSYVAESDQRAIVFLKEQIAFKDKQIESKDLSIRRKERLIVKLFIAIAAMLALIVGALILDGLNPDIGFIRASLGF